MSFDVIVSGLNVVDLLFTLPEQVKRDSKHEVDKILIQGGAPAGNAASVMAMLGLKTAFLGNRGDNVLSDIAERELQRCKVDSSLMLNKPEHNPAVALVEIDANNGERTVFYSLNNYRALAPADVKREWVQNSKLVFVDGYDRAGNIQLLKLARELGVPSVLDVEAGDREELIEMISLGSHAILPLEAAQAITGEDEVGLALPELAKLSDAQIVITDGANGSWAWLAGKVVHQGAFKTEVVDTTGCGDSYHGAYAYALLQGMDIQQRMQFASAYASLVARHVGGRTYHPSAAEVEAVINNNELL
ncbi:carbohydrate kinase family protein [Agaribacterium haliotis]|uniref:carbohydrate kinase family protein n=1 Tax=Agaribacterium haliotis TaxID=2013869 RepID=UPI000BB55333|nr:PfkB family carbohydrate kinase [Agaribacterium haliotis]